MYVYVMYSVICILRMYVCMYVCMFVCMYVYVVYSVICILRMYVYMYVSICCGHIHTVQCEESVLSSCTVYLITSNLEDRHKIALFSNIYNAMIIHATCVLGSPADSPAARKEFFSGRSGATYIIGNRATYYVQCRDVYMYVWW